MHQNQKYLCGFESDDYSGVHPDTLEAIQKINIGHVTGYGDDQYTEQALENFKHHFSEDIAVFFVYSGSGSNTLSMKAMAKSYNSILCAETSHMWVDESCATENFAGCKIIPLVTKDGKISIDQLKPHLTRFGDPMHAQPRVVSITQPTELGTLYTTEELRNLSDFAHSNGLLVHMDGARLSNASASLGVTFREMTNDVGIDVLSFDGTKNGLLFGSTVIFFKSNLANDFMYIQKQGMHFPSDVRFIATQFNTMISNNLWYRNADNANRMAKLLESKVQDIPQINITQKVESNGIWATVPKKYIPVLQAEYPFYVWNEQANEVCWMTSFNTTEEDVEKFADFIRRAVK